MRRTDEYILNGILHVGISTLENIFVKVLIPLVWGALKIVQDL